MGRELWQSAVCAAFVGCLRAGYWCLRGMLVVGSEDSAAQGKVYM